MKLKSIVILSSLCLLLSMANIANADSSSPQEIPSDWQDQIATVVTFAQENYPHDFTESYIDNIRKNGEILFRGQVPRAVTDAASKLPYLKLTGGSGISNMEAQRLHFELVEKLRAENPDLRFGSYVDFRKKTIEIQLDSAQISNFKKMPATLALLKSSQVLRPHFTFESMQESTLDALFGGGYLSSCTSAFSAKSPGKPNLLLTAGHCQPPQSYHSVPLVYEGSHVGNHGDFGVYSTSAYTAPQFYSAPSVLVNVTALKIPSVGQALCRNGQTTGRRCGQTVVTNNYCDSTHFPRVCELTVMNNRQAKKGDSGGPWFSSTYAYGIHSRGLNYKGVARDAFSPVVKAQKLLSITVKTTSSN